MSRRKVRNQLSYMSAWLTSVFLMVESLLPGKVQRALGQWVTIVVIIVIIVAGGTIVLTLILFPGGSSTSTHSTTVYPPP